MKRFAVIVSVLVSIAVVILVGATTSRIGEITPVYYVIASDAPTTFKRKGLNVRVCSGTNDEVQIQAAIDAADTVGGGLVMLSPGTFTVSKPGGATDIVFTADVTDGSAEAVLSNLSFSTGSAGDLTVGRILRVSGGDDGEGNTIEANNRDICMTLMVDNGDGTYDVSEDFVEDYTGCTFVRMIGCIQLKAGVYIRCAGTKATEIKLADNQNCSLITFEGTTTTIGMGMSHIFLNGNRANQGDGSATTFHPECNGILINDHGWDAHFEQVSLESFKGDGWWILQPFGSQIYGGGWTEFCGGSAICYGDGNNGQITDHKIADVCEATNRDADASNDLPGDGATFSAAGIRVMESATCMFKPSMVRVDNQWAFWFYNAHGNRISGVYIADDSAGALGGVLLSPATDSIISGCLFQQRSASSIGVKVRGQENTIVGNRFEGVPKPIEVDGTAVFHANMHDNMGAFITDASETITRLPPDVRTEKLLNDSGSTLTIGFWARRNLSIGSVKIVSGVTTAIDPYGMAVNAINNSAAGFIQIAGYQPRGRIDDAVGANAGAIIVGDELCCSDQTDGYLEEAGSGDWVVAISEGVNSGALDGGVNLSPIYILPPGERYIKP